MFIAINGSFPYAHSHTPEWFCKLNLQLYELETCAALLAILLVATMAKNATMILCVDNTGAQNALISGNSTNPVANQMIATFWQIAAQNNIFVWVGRVDSPTNIADAPSRKCGTGKATNTSTEQAKRLPLPKQFVQIIRTPEALKAAQYDIPPTGG